MVRSQEMDLGSSRAKAGRVKSGSKLGQLFEGWQVGLIVIATAVVTALLAVPRRALPDEIPRPRVEPRALGRISMRDDAWAREAGATPLDFDVRALGEALRAYGKADADGDRETVSQYLTVVRTRVPAAVRAGDEQVLRLRAAQLKIFLDEIERFDASGEESVELREVGGGLIAVLRRSGWMVRDAGREKVMPPRHVLEVFFRKRWNEVTGLSSPPFRLSVEEERAFFAFLFEHPIVNVAPIDEGDPIARCRSANEYLLRKVGELGKVDRAYPASYARGVLLLRLHRPREALAPLADFVDTHDDGPYVLVARNALREAQEQVVELGE